MEKHESGCRKNFRTNSRSLQFSNHQNSNQRNKVNECSNSEFVYKQKLSIETLMGEIYFVFTENYEFEYQDESKNENCFF